jgi:hypothetical protein
MGRSIYLGEHCTAKQSQSLLRCCNLNLLVRVTVLRTYSTGTDSAHSQTVTHNLGVNSSTSPSFSHRAITSAHSAVPSSSH